VGGVTTRLKATLTIKGSAPTAGQSDEAKRTEAALSRCELEYPIPVAEARSLERLSPWPPIVKDRYRVERFELDRFHGAFEGLWIAEIELTSTHELVTIPDWCGPEVTHDVAWSNAELARTQRLADR
jgi:CYTH domain-containing protein